MFLLILVVYLSNCLDTDFEETVSCSWGVTFEGFLNDVVVTVGSFVVVTLCATVSVVVVVDIGSNSCSSFCSSAIFVIRASTYDISWYLSSLSNLLRRIDKA